jgi:hypothetical protein
MRNSINTSLHVHLFYEDESLYLLDRISKVWKNKIYVSIVKDVSSNKAIIQCLNDNFDEVDTTFVDNRGNDQYGFFHSFKKNKDDTKYILYLHDKKDRDVGTDMSKLFLQDAQFLPHLIENVMTASRSSLHLREYQRAENPVAEVGIIACEATNEQMLSYKELESSHACGFGGKDFKDMSDDEKGEYRLQVVRSLHTVTWFDELVCHLRHVRGLGYPLVYPPFAGGNMFLATRDIIKTTHSAVLDSHFQEGYQPDGEVEHAMERLYYYVCKTVYNQDVVLV